MDNQRYRHTAISCAMRPKTGPQRYGTTVTTRRTGTAASQAAPEVTQQTVPRAALSNKKAASDNGRGFRY
ncbi:hypothetical protein NXH56_05075 [Bifidobacterium thermophilum]|nr:hypothetical protein [Bifidobacterium thermophilum]